MTVDREDLVQIATQEGAHIAIDDEHETQGVILRFDQLEKFVARIRAEVLQDAAAYVLANAKIKNSCCAETRASIYTLIKGMKDDN